MALIVEDGTISNTGANSYVAIAYADAYHLDRLNTAWAAATTIEKTAALIKATAYADGKYRNRWKGVRIYSQQPLEWPRAIEISEYQSIYSGISIVLDAPIATIPQLLKDAVCELALRALAAPIAADVTPGDRLIRKKIDVIEKEFAPGDYQTSYPVVDQLLNRLLRSGCDAVRG